MSYVQSTSEKHIVKQILLITLDEEFTGVGYAQNINH